MISWLSRKKSKISLSTAEAEYITACTSFCEAVWIRKLLAKLFKLKLDVTRILSDDHSCIKLLENPVFHDLSKHIEIKYHFIRDMVMKRAVKLEYIATDEQVADVLTKPLAREKFEYFREKLGVIKKDVP